MIANLEQYLGHWALEEKQMRALHALVSDRLWLREHISAATVSRKQNEEEPVPAYSVADGIATLTVSGFITKKGSSLSEYPGNTAMRRMARKARSDDRVQAVLLRVESGGGSVMGVDDLARELRALANEKPLATYIEDIGGSAAYWLGAQAGRMFANPAAHVGSMGVYAVVYDESKAAQEAGVTVHVIRAGTFKGMGERGTQITEEQLAEMQRGVDAINELFVRAVAEGRGIGIAAARKLNDGRVHIGQAAVDEGFIDQVGSEADALSWLRSQIQSGGPTRVARAKMAAPAAEKEPIMANENGKDAGGAATPTPQTPKAAGIKELQKSFPKAGDAFYVACLKEEMTLEQAREAYSDKLQADLEASQAEVEKLKAENGKQKAETGKAKTQTTQGAIGVDPVKDGGGAATGDDPIVAWNKAVDEEFGRCKDRAKAVRTVVHKNKDLHQAYLAAVNERKAG